MVLTLQLKDENWLLGLKNKIQMFVVCKRQTHLTGKDIPRLKVKG
jgi:hypothetical protein